VVEEVKMKKKRRVWRSLVINMIGKKRERVVG
jgi:hypothetical protein